MSLTARARVFRSAAAAIRPAPEETVDEWADNHRRLDSSTSAYPGRWKTSRTQYLREPMRRLSRTDACRMVVLMFASQLGKTEVANNWLGSIIDNDPGPFMLVQPTVETAERYGRTRIAPMIASTPSLKEKVADAKSRDGGNTTAYKEFPGGFAKLVGANAPAGLASQPVRYLAFDEVDRFPESAGSEGDPIELAEKRTTAFHNSKILLVSTPVLAETSRVAQAFAEGDRRQFWVPCPQCGEYQVLRWEQVKWPKGEPAKAFYECEVNGCVIENHDKATMLPEGQWLPSTELEDGTFEVNEDIDADAPQRVHSYQLSALYAPIGWVTWGDLAIEFLRAGKDPQRLQTFVNTRLAQVWEDVTGEKVDEQALIKRCEPHDWRVKLPERCAVLTAGVDVQADRLECEVVGWGSGEESWSIAYYVLPGDPTGPHVWQDLDGILTGDYFHPAGGRLGIVGMCVDSGYCTQEVYNFCAERGRALAIKGKSGQEVVWPRKPSKQAKGRVDLWTVGVDSAKTTVMGRLLIDAPGPGYCHFPAGRDVSWFQQLTAERKRVRYVKGRRVYSWVLPTGKRNEALDCRVYAFAALQGWLRSGRSLERAVASLQDRGRKGRTRVSEDADGKRRRRPLRRAGELDRWRNIGRR